MRRSDTTVKEENKTSEKGRSGLFAWLPFLHHIKRNSVLNKKVEETVKSRPMAVRIFKYFIVFTVIIMLMLWLLQILFLQTFYQQMKIKELYRAANTIEKNYGKESLANVMTDLTTSSDMYIQISNSEGIMYVTASANPGDRMDDFAGKFDSATLKQKLIQSGKRYIVVKKQMYHSSDAEAMIYASVLDDSDESDPTYLFIYSPLSAVTSTVNILSNLLVIVTAMSIVFGIIMSLIISRRLARPVNNITVAAAKLAEGRYDVNFDGTGSAETEELAATLNYASEELSKSDKLQKDLLANVTHDLKTPLTMVKSYAEMVRDLSGDNPEKRNRHLNVIISEADRLNELVNDLTSLSKMQARVDALNLEPVDLKSAAEITMDSFSLHRDRDGFDLGVETVGENFTVQADLKKMRQVFANLIGNAIRYSDESDEKYVRVILRDLYDDGVRCEVVDRGQGISEEAQQSIWDRYYQSSKNHSRASRGTGLGLAIVKQIFILHKCKYGLDSTPGEGSCFWFEIPRDLTKAGETSQ